MNQPLNFSGKIAKIFLENVPLSFLTLFGIIIFGVFGYMMTPKQYNPEVTLPAFTVQVKYPGATASEVQNFVTRELEEKIAEIEGVNKISSFSYDGGMSVVRVEFHVGEDLEISKVKLFSKIQENIDLKVGKIETPIIKNITPDDVPILTFAFTSDTLSQNEMREKLLSLVYELQKVEGVANLEIFGGEKKALKIVLNPEEMKEKKISFQDVQNALLASSGKMSAGYLKKNTSLHEIEVDGGIIDEKKAKEILVFQNIKLGEIAEIKDGYLEKISEVQFLDLLNDEKELKDAIYIGIAKRKGENAIDTANNIFEKFYKIWDDRFVNIDYKVVRNDAAVAEKEIMGLGTNLLQSIAIVSLLLFIFLGGRSAFVVASAIPLTLLFVFFLGYIGDQTINRITLFALILSLGLLVDSATVVVENIFRHLQNFDGSTHDKKNADFQKKTAIIEAVNEVGIGLFLSTLTSVIVFLPMTQITGMMGPYMKPLAFFVPFALLVSMAIAYIITPFLAYLVFRPSLSFVVKEHGFFQKVSQKYASVLRKILYTEKLQKIIIIGVFGLLFLFMSFPIFEIVHFRMLPKADRDQFFITIDEPDGTNFPKTYEDAKTLTLTLSQGEREQKNSPLPLGEGLGVRVFEIESFQIYVGTPPVIDFNGLFRGFSGRSQPNQATIKVNLKKERIFSSEEIASAVREELKDVFQYTEVKFRVVEDPPGPPVQSTLVAKIKGGDKESREQIAKDLESKFAHIEDVEDIDSSIEEPFKKTTFAIDEEKAKAFFISNADIFQALSFAVSPQIISEFHPLEAKEISFIELSFLPENRDQISDLSRIFLKNQKGEMIALSEVVRETSSFHSPSLFFDERDDTVYVTAEMGDRSVIYAVRDLIFQIFDTYKIKNFSLFKMDIEIPSCDNNMAEDDRCIKKSSFDIPSQNEIISIEWGGEFEMTLENFRDLGIAMIIAFVLVYAVLVAQFQSFMIPLLIMATIPLAMIGILPGFAFLDSFFGIYLTATALIGFIALMGIVVNNAIIYLEYLDILKTKGINLKEALVEAGKTRLRPIVLTSLTTVLGSLTIAADPVWSGLAWSIVFGLSLSAFLTLIVFPILYYRNIRW